MRLFVSLELPAVLREGLRAACERGRRGGVLWVPAENVHLTLKFLGEVQYRLVPELKAAVAAVAGGAAPFDLSLAGAGCFPSARAPRVIWVGVDRGADEATALAVAVERALAPLGFAAEARPFRAHLTIGRVKEEKSGAATCATKLKGLASFAAPPARTEALALMKSTLMPAGSAYDEVARFPLGG